MTLSDRPKVYWTAAEEEHAGHIYAMGGAEGQGVLVSGLRHPSSIAVDPWSSKIFWTDSRDQTVSKARSSTPRRVSVRVGGRLGSRLPSDLGRFCWSGHAAAKS